MDDAKKFADSADQHRASSRERSRRQTKAGQDIGPVPEVSDKNWNRRLRCIADPELFLTTYFGFRPFFWLPFSEAHSRVIQKAEDAVRHGGNFSYACWRGFGKTTICRGLLISATLRGLRKFGMFVGAASAHAISSIRTIKTMLERSPLLLEDFPEILFPIVKLEGSSKRQLGQTCVGELTGIHWGKDYIQLPTCPPQKSIRPEQGGGYGALMTAAGLLGSGITGINVDGRRPDFLALDDPQTRQSAKSESQCAAREEIIGAMVTGLAAPGTKLAVFMPCTVMRKDDLADRFLNHELHPEFAIERCKLMQSMPTRTELWDTYRSIRNDYDPYAGPEAKHAAATTATEFYIENQPAMDEGAAPAWKERFNDDEVSAVQNAMNAFADNKFSFMAEMQSDPLPQNLGNIEELSRADVEKRLNNLPRLGVSHGATKLTAFIDVQGIGLLFYVVCWWREDFTGGVLDYGTHPEQGRRYFTKATAPKLLAGGDQALHSGLVELGNKLLRAQYRQENGNALMIDLCLVDSGHQAELVYEFCRQMRTAGYGARILPSKGKGIRASDPVGLTEGAKSDTERRGFGWRLPPPKEARGIRLLTYDTNAWKAFLWDRIAVKDGARGSLTFFGADHREHAMLFDHLFAEYRDRMKSDRTGREVDEFHQIPGKDNDWFDCLTAAAVAASVSDVRLQDVQAAPPRRRVVSFAKQREEARAKRRG